MSEQDLQPELSPEVRQWAMFCHFAAFLGLVLPFGNLIGPLIVWQIKKDVHPFIDDQGKEALNFQISVALAAVLEGGTAAANPGAAVPQPRAQRRCGAGGNSRCALFD